MWILRALAQFKGSEKPPGLFKDCWSYVEHGVVVMTVGSQSGESQFETY